MTTSVPLRKKSDVYLYTITIGPLLSKQFYVQTLSVGLAIKASSKNVCRAIAFKVLSTDLQIRRRYYRPILDQLVDSVVI